MLPALFLVLLSYSGNVLAFSTGAAPGTCNSLTPDHPGNALPNPSGYNVTTTFDEDLGQLIIVISPTQARPVFRGLHLQVRNQNNERVGQLEILDTDLYRKVTCPDNLGGGMGITHTSGIDKTGAVFLWTPPENRVSSDEFAVRVTMVESRPVYWVDEQFPFDLPAPVAQTTMEPSTQAPTTMEPTTMEPTTMEPTTMEPTTMEPTTMEPSTEAPTTMEPTTMEPTTMEPTTMEPTTMEPMTSTAAEGVETTTEGIPKYCSQRGNVYTPTSDCTSFIQRALGREHTFKCPANLLFSTKDCVCNFPQFVKCPYIMV